MKPIQSGLFDESPEPVLRPVASQNTVEQCPTVEKASVPLTGPHTEPDAADRRSYASLAAYIAGSW